MQLLRSRSVVPGGIPPPRVSVVLPTYRRAHQIGATIASVLYQSFEDFELLIRDDGGGNDDTAIAVRRAAANDSRVRYCQNPHKLGMPENLNSGIAQTAGEFVAVCHDHDILAPTFLDKLVRRLDEHPRALFAHCGISVIDQKGRPTGAESVGPWPPCMSGWDWLATMLRSFSCPVCALTLVRREAHERYGLYDDQYGFIADVELWMRLSEHGDIAYVAEPLAQVRTREADHETNLSSWPTLAASFAMHRKYLPKRYRGMVLALRNARMAAAADFVIAKEMAAALRRRKSLRFGPAAAAIRANGGPLGTALAAILG